MDQLKIGKFIAERRKQKSLTQMQLAEKLGFTDIIIPRSNMAGLDSKRFKINIHPVRKVEEALRLLFG